MSLKEEREEMKKGDVPPLMAVVTGSGLVNPPAAGQQDRRAMRSLPAPTAAALSQAPVPSAALSQAPVPSAALSQAPMPAAADAAPAKAGRALMPGVAAIVDDLRRVYGAQLVDAAIAAGQRARREHAAILQANGAAAAARWLRAQKFPQGCFHATEDGREVGINRL